MDSRRPTCVRRLSHRCQLTRGLADDTAAAAFDPCMRLEYAFASNHAEAEHGAIAQAGSKPLRRQRYRQTGASSIRYPHPGRGSGETHHVQSLPLFRRRWITSAS